VVASGPLHELTGQGTGLMLEVDARPDAVAALLRDRGLVVSHDGLRLLITTPSDDVAEGTTPDPHDAARDAVVEAGVGVRRMTDRTVRLEDVFLEVGA